MTRDHLQQSDIVLQSGSSFWFLVSQLVRAEMVSDYKKSFLGLTWMFLLPLLSVLLWIGLHAAGIVNPGETGIPYPVYVLISTSLWNFFHEMYKSSSQVLVSNGRLLLLKDFPVLLLVIKQVFVQLIRFSIILAVNLLVLAAFGIPFTFWMILFPVALLPLMLLATGLGLIMAVFRVILTDISTAFDEFMKVLMFLTPVIYAPKLNWPMLQWIVDWNPVSYLLGACRDSLTMGMPPLSWAYLGSIIFTVAIFAAGSWFFKKAYKRVLERLTA